MINAENIFTLSRNKTAVEKYFKSVFSTPRAMMNEGKVELEAISRFIPDSGVFIDIGANIGTFSRRMIQMKPDAFVIAFEPQSLARNIFKSLLLSSRNKSIVVLPYALGKADDFVQLHIPIKKARNIGIGLAHTGDATDLKDRFAVKSELVFQTTLDRILGHYDLGKVEFIKIDIEGGELNALLGAEQTIAANRPVILCEIDGREDRFQLTEADLVAFFERHKYDARSLSTGEIIPFTALEQNTLFTPQEATYPA